MLVLTRKEGEKILIGPEIEVTVTKVLPDGRVRRGITAPPRVLVLRSEIDDSEASRELARRQRERAEAESRRFQNENPDIPF